MPAYYLDTTALVKRYANERGTSWVASLLAPVSGHTLYTVRLTGPELVAALGRKARTGELTPAEATGAMRIFRRAWCRRYRIVAATIATMERAMDLAARHGLRGYDAVHLARRGADYRGCAAAVRAGAPNLRVSRHRSVSGCRCQRAIGRGPQRLSMRHRTMKNNTRIQVQTGMTQVASAMLQCY